MLANIQAGAAISESALLVYGGRNFLRRNRNANLREAETKSLHGLRWTSATLWFITPLHFSTKCNVACRGGKKNPPKKRCGGKKIEHLEFLITNSQFFFFFLRKQLCSHLWSGREYFWSGSPVSHETHRFWRYVKPLRFIFLMILEIFNLRNFSSACLDPVHCTYRPTPWQSGRTSARHGARCRLWSHPK